ncbi:hypothetical protein D2S45_11470 [Prevotella intermedia]|uniref:Uncharacterized protein n=1 Tax=Prevotella intermedia TaxID=28131 RepID=A0A3R8HH41_PREIN|nr:hypothetical protein D2S53_11340 [Prevotella intermedia]RRF86411.1 hypothetical protein D2S45_11470 [Prevotella intermedia]
MRRNRRNIVGNNLPNERKTGDESVNIFGKRIYRITTSLSTHYKTYCFTFQKRRFCKVKAAVLHCKTYAFATLKRNYHFLTLLSLQNQCSLSTSTL